MGLSNLKKLTLIVNTSILFMVFGLMAFFHVIKATFLVYFSIPTVLVYVIGYILIYKEALWLCCYGILLANFIYGSYYDMPRLWLWVPSILYVHDSNHILYRIYGSFHRR